MSAGEFTTLALRNDGAVFAWGGGFLGNGTTNPSLTPIQVPGLSTITAIASGYNHSLALDAAGHVWSWGDNLSGDVGNGTANTAVLAPVELTTLSNIVGIAAGYDHSVALDSSGNIYCWGDNTFNQCDGTVNNEYLSPVRFSGLAAVRSIAAEAYATYALRSDGTVWAWGGTSDSGVGLGQGTIYGSLTPVQVKTSAGVSAIATGRSSGYALFPNGTVQAWGYNKDGELGNGTTTTENTPVTVSITGASVIAAGGGSGYAIQSNGTEMSWGLNTSGELGNGATTNATKPVAVSGVIQASAVGGGESSYVGLTVNGPLPALMTPPYGGNVSAPELYGGQDLAEPDCMCSQTNGGDPVNTATGNYSETYTDMSIPGRGVALSLSRTYNSLNAAASGPFGYGWSFNYNMSLAVNGSTAVVTQEDGAQVTFTQSNGVYSAPPRVIATLVANQDGSYTFTRQHKAIFTFNAQGQLTAESDLNSYTTTLAYNPSGQLATVTDPAGRTLSFTWTGSNISSVTDSASPARQVSFGYNDGAGDLTDVTDVGGGVTHFTYDSSHHLLTVLDPNQQGSQSPSPLTNTYDPSGRVTKQTDPMGRVTTFDYTSVPGATKVTDPNGNVRLDTYEDGELVQVTYGYGSSQAATWSYSYDPTTLGITKTTDPNGHSTTATYDPSTGMRLTSIDALNHKTTSTYDSLGDLTSSTDPNNVTTTYTYDAAGNLLSQSTPLVGSSPAQSQTTTYTYGDASHLGDVTAKTDPDNQVWSYTYDGSGDLASVTDPLGNETTYGYDTIGRRTSMVSPLGNVTGGNPAAYTTNYGYDAFGDQTSVTDPLSHSTAETYDADRNLKTQTDADTNTTTYAYDLDNELTQVTRADQTTLGYGYDGDGNQTSQTDGRGHATTYAFTDPALPSKATSMTDADGRKTTYGFDGAGNQTTVTDPSGRVTTTAYDAANEVTSITYGDGTTPNVSAIAYDPDGQRTSMTDGTGTSTWVYDSLHRLTSQTNGAGQTVAYGYDLKGQQTSITYPGNKTVAQVFDAAGNMRSVTDWLNNTTTFTYDPNSELTTEAYPNNTTATTAYDAAGNVASITDAASGATYASFGYTRNGDNLLTSTTPTGVSQTNETYGYTPLNQLQTVSSASSPYSYDPSGNVTTLGNGSTLSYDPADQIQGVPYDAQGNRQSSGAAGATGTQGYGYNQANQLASVSEATPGMIAGGLDHTVALRADGTVWDWGYNNDGQLGNNSTTTSKVPIQVPGLSGMTMVAAGRSGYHTLALKSDGTVWAWGLNTDGQLGNNSTTTSKVPVQVSGLTGATAIAAGADHSLALRSDGTVWAWGYNSSGQLGNNTTTTEKVPVQVSSLTGVVAIAADANDSLALKSDGTVWAWGANNDGQLGNNSTTSSKVPVQVSSLTGVTAIAGGANHNLAVKSDGTVWAWGYNSSGQLGNNTTTTEKVPVQVSGLTGVTQVAGGASHSLALKSDGTVWAWGANTDGQLGNKSTTSSKVPVQATGLGAGEAIGAGDNHSLAVTTAGTFWAWGYNTDGQLGNNSTTNATSALQSTGLASTTATYAYNGDGLRQSKTVNGATEAFTWDTSGSLSQLLVDGSTDFLYGPGGVPIEQVGGDNTVDYLDHDALGSIRAVTDSTGVVLGTASYDSYGVATRSLGFGTPFGFAGQYTDAETGLVYMRARYYDTAVGQFMSVDPAVPTTHQAYLYSSDDPLNVTDVSGLAPSGGSSSRDALQPSASVSCDPYAEEDALINLQAVAREAQEEAAAEQQDLAQAGAAYQRSLAALINWDAENAQWNASNSTSMWGNVAPALKSTLHPVSTAVSEATDCIAGMGGVIIGTGEMIDGAAVSVASDGTLSPVGLLIGGAGAVDAGSGVNEMSAHC